MKALLFDMDGTLADTDPLHYRAFAAVLLERGIAIDEDFFQAHMTGRTNREIGRLLLPDQPEIEHLDLAERKETMFRSMAGSLRRLAGLDRILEWRRHAGLRAGLVTNAPRENARHILAALHVDTAFDIAVFGEEISRPKPDPMPYITALERLGITPADAVVFEDSVPGITSAKAAGILTFGLMTSQPAEYLRDAGADHVIANFGDPFLWQYLEARTAAAARPA